MDYFFTDAKILFVGINPHFGSFARGVPFSNNKMFWYLLADSGLISERREDLRDDTKLRNIYRTKFNQTYKLGLVNMVDRPSRDVSSLKKGEEEFGRERLHRIILRESPRVVCFIGKITYQKFSNQRQIEYGWQSRIGESEVFVMHFPIRGPAEIRIKELRTIASKLIDN